MKLSTIIAVLGTLASSPSSHAVRIPNVQAGRPLDMIHEPHQGRSRSHNHDHLHRQIHQHHHHQNSRHEAQTSQHEPFPVRDTSSTSSSGSSNTAPKLQDIITYDRHSLFIRGERAMIFSGSVHPFRLPVPDLYLDVFQKIKALGFNTVTFYVDWALLEGTQGEFRDEDIFDLKNFFDAAKEVGLYMLARPGPYINAEASGGGFPGWLQRNQGILRDDNPEYLDATNLYMEKICGIIADAQITNGGPIILFQPENEYSISLDVAFPNKAYMQYVIDQALKGGIVVPLINNDAAPEGNFAPGTGNGSVDIYGHDGYPLGFDCGNPYVWPPGYLPTDWHALHEEQSPTTPYSLVEFQGGSFDPFGGDGFDQCAILLNEEFERVFYKNNFAAGATIFNIYMLYGGSNWGNIGHPLGYSSYDYGASIKEDRSITREKYAELKLQGQFIKVSPGYLVADAHNLTVGIYSSNRDITVTPVLGDIQGLNTTLPNSTTSASASNKHRSTKGKDSTGSFFIVRHTNYASQDDTPYTLRLPTSAGVLSIPQLGGTLMLDGRDSKVHVVDYPLGQSGYGLLYSTAEVFTWKQYGDKTVLVLYGGSNDNEMHEVAVKVESGKKATQTTSHEGSVEFHKKGDSVVFQWQVSPQRKVVQIGNLLIYLLNRNSAYNYWVPLIPSSSNPDGPEYGSSVMSPDAVIVNGGYLIRSASISGSTLSLQADFNTTSPTLEIVGFPSGLNKLVVNGQQVDYTVPSSALGNWVAQPKVDLPYTPDIPALSSLEWHAVDSLPEVTPGYSDAAWPKADLRHTYNTATPQLTPTSLFASDYKFDYGAILLRGHFTSTGKETQFRVWTQGGEAYSSSVWLNGTFLGSFAGNPNDPSHNDTYSLPRMKMGSKYVLTVVVDSTGLEENGNPGLDQMKAPHGILDYALLSGNGKNSTRIAWKLTGNLGGEDYIDKFRGPLNEGGLYFERQGLHLPGAPLSAFTSPATSPFNGTSQAGITFYAANLPLSIPSEKYDIPLSFHFDNTTSSAAYRAVIFVNGFQFGKYVQNIGPQTVFPVPEGIFNYNGDNWIGVAVWAMTDEGAKLPGFSLQPDIIVQSGRPTVHYVDPPSYAKRPGAY